MLNWLAKFLLAASGLSPMLGAVAVDQAARHRPWTVWVPWLCAAAALVALCWGVLRHAARHGERLTFRIGEFEDKDKEVLAYLLTYLLPFLASDKLEFKGDWITGAYIMTIIMMTVVHAGALHFNPVMGLFSFHFYAVRDGAGAPTLLISPRPLRRAGEEIEAVRLADNIYLGTRR